MERALSQRIRSYLSQQIHGLYCQAGDWNLPVVQVLLNRARLRICPVTVCEVENQTRYQIKIWPNHTVSHLNDVVLIVLLCVLLILPAACQCKEDVEKLFDRSIVHAFTRSGEEGVLTAFHGQPGMEESQLQLAFRSDEKLPFKLYFLAKNQTASERKWKLMYFFDYKNTFVDVAGKEAL